MHPTERLRRNVLATRWRQERTHRRLADLPEWTTAEEAARASYEAWHDVELGDEQEVVASCGSGECVNPEHLELTK